MATQTLLALDYIRAAHKDNRNELEGSIDKVDFVVVGFLFFVSFDLRSVTSVIGKGFRMVE